MGDEATVDAATAAEEKKFYELKEYTEEEIYKHNEEEDCWLLIHNRVYNVTKYMDSHPGGPEIMTQAAGNNATNE